MIGMSSCRLALILLLTTAFAPCLTAQEGDDPPIILIYSGPTPDWGQRLAEIIENDGRFEADVQVVEDRTIFEAVVNFPRVAAVVLCPLEQERNALMDISDLTTAYFLDGGAVMGIGVSCTSRYAPGIGPSVFSISGNRSLTSKRIGERRVFTYEKRDVIQAINAGIEADTFQMEGYLAFYSAASDGSYVPIPANGTRHILYAGENDAPLVIAFESDSGGTSIAFPGLTVQVVDGRDNYYGLLFERSEFSELFLNGLKWIMDSSPRYDRLKGIASQALEGEATRRADLAAEAERLANRIESRRLTRLAILWAIGLGFCAVVFFKMMLVRD
jgi:hypothetical protein